MEKQELITMITNLLDADVDFDFLMKLETGELETLVATIRDRIS